jgi:hypothetical protein
VKDLIPVISTSTMVVAVIWLLAVAPALEHYRKRKAERAKRLMEEAVMRERADRDQPPGNLTAYSNAGSSPSAAVDPPFFLNTYHVVTLEASYRVKASDYSMMGFTGDRTILTFNARGISVFSVDYSTVSSVWSIEHVEVIPREEPPARRVRNSESLPLTTA